MTPYLHGNSVLYGLVTQPSRFVISQVVGVIFGDFRAPLNNLATPGQHHNPLPDYKKQETRQ